MVVWNYKTQFLNNVTSDVQTQLNNLALNITNQEITFTATFTTSSASMVDVTGCTVTLPDRHTSTPNKGDVQFFISWSNSTAVLIHFQIVDNAVAGNPFVLTASAGGDLSTTRRRITGLTGQIVKLQAFTAGGTLSVFGTTAGSATTITSWETSQP